MSSLSDVKSGTVSCIVAIVVVAAVWATFRFAADTFLASHVFAWPLDSGSLAAVLLVSGAILGVTRRVRFLNAVLIGGCAALTLFVAETTSRMTPSTSIVFAAEILIPSATGAILWAMTARAWWRVPALFTATASLTVMAASTAAPTIVRGYLEMIGILRPINPYHYSGVHTFHTGYDYAIVVTVTLTGAIWRGLYTVRLRRNRSAMPAQIAT